MCNLSFVGGLVWKKKKLQRKVGDYKKIGVEEGEESKISNAEEATLLAFVPELCMGHLVLLNRSPMRSKCMKNEKPNETQMQNKMP